MTVESTRSTAAYTSVFVFLVFVSFQLQGCSNGGDPAAMMSGACEGWCEGDQWTVENGQSHKERHCGGDMSSLCGGCDYCSSGDSSGSDSGGSDSGGDSSGSCADQLNDYSQNNGACIAIKDNKVLLIQAQPYSTWKPDYSWDIPGGTNDHTPKEHTCEVAKRETAEEGQIAVTPYAKTSNANVYLCRYEGPDTSHNSPEAITKRQWFTLEEFRNLELRYAWGEPGAGGYRNIVEEALR